VTQPTLPGEPDKTTRYAVSWRHAGTGGERRSYVSITESYSKIDDIPKILSIRFGEVFGGVLGYVEA
jgi:hypothetical protein